MSDKLQNINTDHLLNEIKQMIKETQTGIAATVNAGLTLLYWHIGKCINDEILEADRAKYGKRNLATLSQELITEYGRGFSL